MQPAEQESDRQAADIAEKQPRDRPVERREADDRAEQRERDQHGAGGGAAPIRPSSTTPAVTGTTSATVIQSMPSMKFTRLTNQTPPSSSSARSSAARKLRHDAESRPAARR